ncbi:MAG: hypothetical protein KY432_05955 [Acidobacteria bacterium]|nr:hypothetical protein [Acidobacteriota bacterium]
MSRSRQQIVVCLIAALSLITLLHIDPVLEAGASHCNVCIQQSHGIVAHAITITGDEQIQFSQDVEIASFPGTGAEQPADSRAPPV